MQIKDEQINRFQKLYKEKFGIDISKQDALDQSIKLVHLTEIVLKQKAKEMSEKKTTESEKELIKLN